jgi:mRNA-degrading endonuclease toxin of MazEF toxin-antitoxin module
MADGIQTRQGQIWLADLGTQEKPVTEGKHYVVVVTCDSICRIRRAVNVVAITTDHNNVLAGLPYVVEVHPHETGLPHISKVNAAQLISIANSRLIKYVGMLNPVVLDKVLNKIKVVLGFEKLP